MLELKICSIFEVENRSYRTISFYNLYRNERGRLRVDMVDTPEQGNLVEGRGVGGCVVPIKAVKVIGMAQWEPDAIVSEQSEYLDTVANAEGSWSGFHLDHMECFRKKLETVGIYV